MIIYVYINDIILFYVKCIPKVIFIAINIWWTLNCEPNNHVYKMDSIMLEICNKCCNVSYSI